MFEIPVEVSAGQSVVGSGCCLLLCGDVSFELYPDSDVAACAPCGAVDPSDLLKTTVLFLNLVAP